MKKFKKLFAGVLVTSMFFSQAVFAEATVTRMEFTKILMDSYSFEVDMEAESPFEDVSGEDGAYAAAAQEANIINGYDDGTFRPDEAVTLEQGIVIALNAKGLADAVSEISDDAAEQILGDSIENVSPWAQKYVAYAVLNGLVEIDGVNTSEPISEEMSKMVIVNINAFDPEMAKPLPEPMIEEEAPVTSNNEDTSGADLLLEADEAMQKEGSYKVNCTMQMNENLMFLGESVDILTDISLEEQVQLPDKLNLKTSVSAEGETVTSEIYIDGNSLYVKSPESGEWIMTGEIPASIFASEAMLSEERFMMGEDYITPGEDVEMDGKVYKTVNLNIDSEGYKNLMTESFGNYGELINDSISASLPEDMSAEEKAMIQDMVNSMLESLAISANFVYYIDSETMFIEKIDMTMDMSMSFEVAGNKAEAIVNSSGTFDVYDVGVPIEFPEVQ